MEVGLLDFEEWKKTPSHVHLHLLKHVVAFCHLYEAYASINRTCLIQAEGKLEHNFLNICFNVIIFLILGAGLPIFVRTALAVWVALCLYIDMCHHFAKKRDIPPGSTYHSSMLCTCLLSCLKLSRKCAVRCLRVPWRRAVRRRSRIRTWGIRSYVLPASWDRANNWTLPSLQCDSKTVKRYLVFFAESQDDAKSD